MTGLRTLSLLFALGVLLVVTPGSAQVFTDEAAIRGVTDIGAAQCPAFGDYDNDGDEDMVLCVDVGGAARLFVNNGSGYFTEDTAEFTSTDILESNVACWFDYDKDGDLDIVFGAVYNPSELFRNDSGSFNIMSGSLSLTDSEFSNTLALLTADFDKNGYADIFMGRFGSTPHRLYSNSAGVFVDAATPPLSDTSGYFRSANAIDYDNDGDIDIYHHNGDGSSLLFRNDGSGVWTDVASGGPLENAGKDGRGAAWGDLDLDGDLDCVFGNYETTTGSNVIARNDGGDTFTAITGTPFNDFRSGISPVLFDYDNDGDLDIFVHFAYWTETGPAALYRNDGSFTFTDVTGTDAPSFLTDLVEGRGASVADIDNDGDLDLYRTGGVAGQSSYLYINSTNNNNWLKVKIVGTISDPQAFGAHVSVYQAGTATLVGYSQVQSQNGYEGFNSLIQHFGVPSTGTYDVEVFFPTSGLTMYQNGVSATQTITITEFAGPTPTPTNTPIVAEVGSGWTSYR